MRPTGVVTAWVLLVVSAGTVWAQPAAQARVSLATQGDIWVGQRVVIGVELLVPGTFASAPAFDLPEVSGVILVPPEGRPLIGNETINDTTFTSQRHELLVFAQRAGEVTIPAFTVRFESSPAFGQPAAEQRVTTTPVSFTAKMPPGAEGLSTVITASALTVNEAWDPALTDAPLKVGDALTRTITIEASDVPAMVLPAIRLTATDGLRVYPRPPTVEDRTERGDATGRRVESATYVCEKAGTYSLPALIFAWWDPKKGTLERIELPAHTIVVAAPTEPAPSQSAAPVRTRWWPWVLAATALLAVAGAAWYFGPAVSRHRRERQRLAAESEASYFRRFEDACRSGDARATNQSLLAWIDRYFKDDPAPRIDAFSARAGDAQLTAELSALQTAVYSGAGAGSEKPRWSPPELLLRVRVARASLGGNLTAERTRSQTLPPLNPASIGECRV